MDTDGTDGIVESVMIGLLHNVTMAGLFPRHCFFDHQKNAIIPHYGDIVVVSNFGDKITVITQRFIELRHLSEDRNPVFVNAKTCTADIK